MAHHDVRLARYQDFNPEANKWRDDKRVFERATGALQVIVAKNYATLGIPSVAIYPEIDKGNFVGCKIAAPDGPLKDYFDKDENKQVFFDLMQEAFVDALAKKEKVREGIDVTTCAIETRMIGFAHPPRPVWIMTEKQLETYFSGLKTQLAAEDKIKIVRKWPKMENGKAIKLPTKIPLLDEVAERILPSDCFIPGQKFAPGNLKYRLQLVCAYIMLKYQKAPNTFASEVPEDYEPKKLTLKDLKEISKNVEESAKQNEKKAKEPTIEHHVPFWADDLDIDYDAVGSDEEIFPHTQQQNTSQETPVPSPNSLAVESLPINPQGSTPALPRSMRTQPPGCSTQRPSTSSRTQPILSNCTNKESVVFNGMVTVTQPVPDDVFFDVDEVGLNTSHETGTPANSETGDDVFEEEAMMIRMTQEIEKQDELRDLMKATDIRKLLSGSKCDDVVLQTFNFEKIGRGKCYRAHGQNGVLATTKITFSANLNEQVKEMDKKLPVMKIYC